jgi:uncharacterized coiled-coil DUF342 family protein
MEILIYIMSLMRYNPDEVLSSNWQNDLTFGIERIQEKLEDALSRVGNNPEAKKTYQEAMDATRKARENISRFVDTYNHEYPGAAEPEWSRAGSP